MLRVNVGLSRKLSKDYNSTGFSINLDGEVTAPTSDPEAVCHQISELYHLAEEALDQQIERHQSDDAFASRDAEPAPPANNGKRYPETTRRTNGQPPRNEAPADDEAATNKQVQYLLNIAKRQGLTTAQLEERIEQILGRPTGIYDLGKRAAAVVIDTLTGNGAKSSRTNGRH